MDLVINTDPKLPPKVRYCLVVNEYLQNDGFKYLKSKNSFVKKTHYGQIQLSLSFINTLNLIHSVGYSFHYIFSDIENEFEKLFGKIWTNWTIHIHLGYSNKSLYGDSGYSNNSISGAVKDFLGVLYPQVKTLEQRFDTKDKVIAEYISAPNEFVDFVPSSRLERRVLMCLMLTKMFKKELYDSNLEKSKKLIAKYKGADKAEQEREIQRGITILKTSN